MTNGEGQKTEYSDFDVMGNPRQMKDARGNISRMTYNAKGWKLTDANALGHATTYGYDTIGNRVSVTDPLNNITRYRYNLRNELKNQRGKNQRGQGYFF